MNNTSKYSLHWEVIFAFKGSGSLLPVVTDSNKLMEGNPISMIPNLLPTRTTNVREVVRDCTSSPHVKFISYSEMIYLSVGLIGMSNVT